MLDVIYLFIIKFYCEINLFAAGRSHQFRRSGYYCTRISNRISVPVGASDGRSGRSLRSRGRSLRRRGRSHSVELGGGLPFARQLVDFGRHFQVGADVVAAVQLLLLFFFFLFELFDDLAFLERQILLVGDRAGR